MLQCNSCKCKPICKEIDNWKKYCEEHVRLRKESVLFDREPMCPYYINNNPYYKPKSDLDAWIEQEKNTFKPLIKEVEGLKIEPMIKYDLNDSIDKTFKPICKCDTITSRPEDSSKENYDFVKELEKLFEKNGLLIVE